MTLIEQLFLLDRLDSLIHRKATGTRAALARKLELTPRSVTNYINHLRNLGAEIEMCAERQSYIYLNEFRFQLTSVCSFSQTENVKGGGFLPFFLEGEKFLQGEGVFLW